MNTKDNPLTTVTPSTDSPTPRTDAYERTNVHFPYADQVRHLLKFAKELERENAALVKEANARFVSWEKAELDLQVAQKHNNEQAVQLLALQAHVEKLRTALSLCVQRLKHVNYPYETDTIPIRTGEDALSSQPDLPLIEEVRDYLEDAKTYANTFTLRQRAEQLLARLNPRK